MKYINVFDNDTDYVSYRDGSEYIKPNVSLSRDTKVVHYNYPIWDTNGKPFVDLGLPSGTLWATCNVGASVLTDYGQYFQWGDISGYTADQVGTGDGKKKFDLANYKFSINGSNTNFNKYTTAGVTLELEDDAAHANMKGDWHIPSPEQFQELIDNTTASDGLNGIAGVKLASKTDTSKFIFFPAAGQAEMNAIRDSGNTGCFWCSKLDTNEVGSGEQFGFSLLSPDLNFGISILGNDRSCGLSVRGVLG